MEQSSHADMVSYWSWQERLYWVHNHPLSPAKSSSHFSCVCFYASHRFPVEHVQTPGGQTTFEAWKPFIVGALFLSILLIVFFFLPVKICRDLSAGSLLPLSSLLSCTVRAMAINCLFGMWDRFPLEHVHTPGGQLPLVTLSWVLNNSLPLSDRFPVEQVHTPGGQTASCSDEKVWNDFSLSVTGPALMK